MLALTRQVGETVVIKDVYRFTVESINHGISAIIKFENQQDAVIEYLEFAVGEPIQVFDELSMRVVQFRGNGVRIAWDAPREWHAYRAEKRP